MNPYWKGATIAATLTLAVERLPAGWWLGMVAASAMIWVLEGVSVGGDRLQPLDLVVRPVRGGEWIAFYVTRSGRRVWGRKCTEAAEALEDADNRRRLLGQVP